MHVLCSCVATSLPLQGTPAPGAAAAAAAPPPPKAQPPKPAVGGGGAGGPPAGLFAALNKGGDVTQGRVAT